MPPKGTGPRGATAVADATAPNHNRFAVTSGKVDAPQAIVIYGPGGVGKTSLAALAPNPVLIDIEKGTLHLDLKRIDGIETFADLRACLQSDVLDPYKTVVVDSGTK